MLQQLELQGLRGFETNQVVPLAVAGGTESLGLTIFVGENNSGKSTVVEALRALSQHEPPSFSQGRRNVRGGDSISLSAEAVGGARCSLESLRPGTSETTFGQRGVNLATNVLVLPSRRVFSPYFGRSRSDRNQFMQQIGFPPIRSSQVDPFAYRLFKVSEQPDEFNRLLEEILGYRVTWSIDQSDNGQYFLKVTSRAGGIHTSEGMGEGLVSLMFIVDALYDSNPGQTIVIDEPELSLHPQYQRALRDVFARYAVDRQVVLCTHSPYFVDIASFELGQRLGRVVATPQGSEIHMLSVDAGRRLSRFVRNQNNPHIVGINAREVLFARDGIVLLEGQEDVIFMDVALDHIGEKLGGSIFGWGVGGADNMSVVAQALSDLGFARLVGLLDANRRDLIEGLQRRFPSYLWATIPADDIRSKSAVAARLKVDGLLDDENLRVRDEHVEGFRQVIARANAYLKAQA